MVKTIHKSDLIPYGHIRKTHGHRGNLVISVESDSMLDLDLEYLFIEIDGIPVPFAVEEMSGPRNHLITSLARVSSVDEAEKYRGAAVYITRSVYESLIDLDDAEEILLDYFVGYQLKHPSGREIGILRSIDESTSNILLIAENEEGTEIFLPFVEKWIVGVDHKAHYLLIDCPIDLLELN